MSLQPQQDTAWHYAFSPAVQRHLCSSFTASWDMEDFTEHPTMKQKSCEQAEFEQSMHSELGQS